MDNIVALAIVMGVPTAITAFCSWMLQRRIAKRDKAQEDKERNREQLEVMLLKSTSAAIALGEATARAVQRIPDANCNGDMHQALDYASKIKHEQKDFLTSVGVHAMHED